MRAYEVGKPIGAVTNEMVDEIYEALDECERTLAFTQLAGLVRARVANAAISAVDPDGEAWCEAWIVVETYDLVCDTPESARLAKVVWDAAETAGVVYTESS